MKLSDYPIGPDGKRFRVRNQWLYCHHEPLGIAWGGDIAQLICDAMNAAAELEDQAEVKSA